MNNQNNSSATAASTEAATATSGKPGVSGVPGVPESPSSTRAELPAVKASGTAQTNIETVQPTQPEENPVRRFVINDTHAVITLETPIRLGGDQVIERVTLRMPRSGELRGLALVEMGNLEVDTLIKLLPRITTPTLSAPMIDQMMPYDLLNISRCVSGFFGSKKQREQAALEMERET